MENLNNSNNSLVSIVVPIYNVEKYLEKCIISLIHQTYQNLEIILVVDGSPDASIDICKKWASKDDRIKIINKENGGLSDARNSGLKAASGELISFVDSDDWVSINMIEKMVNAIKSNNVDMAICQFVSVYPNGYMEKNYNSEIDSRIVNRDELSELTLKDDEITSHVWRRLYKRSLIPEDVFPKGRNFEDIFATPRLIEKSILLSFLMKLTIIIYRMIKELLKRLTIQI
ncbi:MAG: glycosyltransferase family 2 protein [Streptococcus sp.]|nr:glycosyltransferase family 2 protein [Streptococcus sp.]